MKLQDEDDDYEPEDARKKKKGKKRKARGEEKKGKKKKKKRKNDSGDVRIFRLNQEFSDDQIYFFLKSSVKSIKYSYKSKYIAVKQYFC